jgi:ABC-type cobalamin/Fe3+-siderophores transport system ATPase subunit
MNTNKASTINFNQNIPDSTKSNIFPFPQLTQNQKQQQFQESFELAGGAEAWVEKIERECIEGSAISPALVDRNVQFIEDTGRWEINDRLNQAIVRFPEGNLETGEWNRHRNHNYLAAAFFVSENGEIFNAKVANAKENYEKTFKGFGEQPKWEATGKMRRYEAVKDGGNRILWASLDRDTRILINMRYGCNMPLTGNIWPWVLEHPEIPVGITEGAKKALALCSQGFLCVAVLGIANWSIPRTKDPETGQTDKNEARVLMPELAELAKGGRLIPIWYDQDDPKTKMKALQNSKSEGNLLATALKAVGANKETTLMWWPDWMGKGIDDVIVRLIQQGESIDEWIEVTIAGSKDAGIYSQITQMYTLPADRVIESQTKGGYLSNHLDLKLEPGNIHAIIAGTGAGKTTLIKGLVSDWLIAGGFVLIVTPTNNLGKQLAEDVRLPHRHDFFSEDLLQMQAQHAGGLICCVDSLYKVEKFIPRDMPLLVILEEADQVANHATIGQTLKKGKYALAQEALSKVLTQAQSVILAEARIPENTLRYVEQLSGKPTRVFIHELEILKRQVTCYSGHVSGFEAMIFHRVNNGERVLVTSDSQKVLEKLERLLRQEIPDLKALRNDRKTSFLAEIKELTISPNEVLARELVQVLFYSPSCKSGWDLTGQDKQGNEYVFDRVMAIMRVLPTSEQIQLLARYRLDCPWEIFLPETIQVTGDEAVGSPRKLYRKTEEEASQIAHGWNIPYDPTTRSPLEKIARDHYVVATARAGLEKRINRYSMVQRLTEDGHTVTEEKLSYNKKMADRMKVIGDEIDQEWADLVASIPLGDGDTISFAEKLEQIEAPRPEQTAKAKKIRLVFQHPGVDFDNAEICYHAIRKYEAMVKGVDAEAAARNPLVVNAAQKKTTLEQFEESILAVHHLPHKADKVALIRDCGILEMVTSGDAFTFLSPEVLALKGKILAKAAHWKRHFGFNFAPEQEPITFMTRAARCLTIKFDVSRPGTEQRLRHYRVYTTELIDERLEEVMEQLEQERAKYDGKTENQLDRIVDDKEQKSRAKFIRKHGRPPEGFHGEFELFNEVMNIERVNSLDVLTAEHQKRIDKLLALRSEVEIRAILLESALRRYAASSSIGSITSVSDIERMDGDGIEGLRRDRSAPDLATG